LIAEINSHGTALVATSQGIDTTSENNSAGRLQLNVLMAVAEFERDVIVERINAGLAAARERGAKFGRPRTLDKHVAAVAELKDKGLSNRAIAAELKIPAGSVSALLRRGKEKARRSIGQRDMARPHGNARQESKTQLPKPSFRVTSRRPLRIT
jgi:DNA invertase Pin-like site-specific DNA recombinase